MKRSRRHRASWATKPVGVHLVPMSEEEFVAFQTRSIRGYAEIQVAAGLWMRRGAGARAAVLLRAMLPAGLRTPDQYCWTIRDRRSAAAVGHLWAAVITSSGRREAFIYDIEIDATLRGRGYGAAALRALAGWARRKHLPVIRLRVHAHNTGARSLYDKAGFAVTDVMMALPVSARRRRRAEART